MVTSSLSIRRVTAVISQTTAQAFLVFLKHFHVSLKGKFLSTHQFLIFFFINKGSARGALLAFQIDSSSFSLSFFGATFAGVLEILKATESGTKTYSLDYHPMDSIPLSVVPSPVPFLIILSQPS